MRPIYWYTSNFFYNHVLREKQCIFRARVREFMSDMLLGETHLAQAWGEG